MKMFFVKEEIYLFIEKNIYKFENSKFLIVNFLQKN